MSDPAEANATQANETEADEAMNELGSALRLNGITLPSMRVCPTVLTGSPPLVDIGSVNIETVRRLTEALREAAGGGRAAGA
ncbi:hypothetical protein [Streptomyces sp. ODS28]|uniref:hypothetical protein n=1 Tax=Streptomyces sp. ODS28 TaxID=3136688 RepID=UPI0031EB71FF